MDLASSPPFKKAKQVIDEDSQSTLPETSASQASTLTYDDELQRLRDENLQLRAIIKSIRECVDLIF